MQPDRSTPDTRCSSSTGGSPAPTRNWPRGYPGDRGVRQPVHTVYVPADRYDAGHRRPSGASRARGADRARCRPPTRSRTRSDPVARPRGRDLDRVRGQARPPSRSRTCGSTSRTATDRARRGRGRRRLAAARALAAIRSRRCRAAVLRHPVQELRGADATPRAAHARPVPRRAGPSTGGAARRLRGHAAEGHVGRAGRGDGRRLRALEAASRARGRQRCGSRSRSRPRRRSSAPTARHWWRG